MAPSVLVADDEPRLLRLMERLLVRAGYDVMTARDGDEAARVYRAHRGAIGAAASPQGISRSHVYNPVDRKRKKDENRDVSPPAAADYVELRCRSAFSFLEGASNPEDLVERAADLGYPALALGDRDGLYGAPRFHQAAQAAGLRGIVGARVSLDGSVSLLLLVESPRGYRNLSRLLTVGHARPKAAQRGGAERRSEGRAE